MMGRGRIEIGFALDIGTTMLKGAVVNRATGRIKRKGGIYNPQNRFGSDIITRISVATAGKYQVLRRLLFLGIAELKNQLGIQSPGLTVVVGNPVNLSFFLNKSLDGFRTYPFQGELQGGVFLKSPPSYIFPCLAGFVGGDTIAGLLASRLTHFPQPALYIDLGTNGEVAVLVGGRILVTSTAAGPALEDHYLGLKQKDFANSFPVPTGRLCASNLINLLRRGLKDGWLSANGRLLKAVRVRGVKIGQEDVRRFQLAVGAIHTGVEILLEKARLKPPDIKKVVITGEFGARLSSEALTGIGLIPEGVGEIVKERDLPLKGAIMALGNENLFTAAEEIRRKSEHVELALMPDFAKRFVSALRLAPWG